MKVGVWKAIWSSIVVSILLTISALSVPAQKANNGGLVMVGTLYKPPALSFSYDDRRKSSFEFDVYMQMRNDSDEPMIVFRPTNFYGERRIQFSTALTLKDKSAIGKSFTLPWKNSNDYDRFPSYVNSLKTEQPSTHLFEVIQPGGYYEFRDTFKIEFIDPEFEFEKSDSDYRKKYLASNPVSEFPSFTIEYHLSSKKLVPGDDDFLRSRQRRWKSSGKLVLDGSGDYSVTSETILGITTN